MAAGASEPRERAYARCVTAITWEERPKLRRPFLIAAFEGWNDAADASTAAARWLIRRFSGTRCATIDADESLDLQSTRPLVSLIDGVIRTIEWPHNDCYAVTVPGAARDLVVVIGVEPNFGWRRYCADVLEVAHETGCELVVTLGALLADVPHTRALPVTGTATDDELIGRLHLERSRYEGPTGIVGVLHDACRAEGIPSASLWASVPHYVASPPNPVATLALLDRLGALTGVPVDRDELGSLAGAWRTRVDELVGEDAEIGDYVRRLEEQADKEHDGLTVDLDVSGDELAAELERYLREQHDE